MLVSLPCTNLALLSNVVCACAFVLQEQFLSSEFLQLVEKCRMMKSHGSTLPDIKLVPGMVSFSIYLSLNDLM